MMRVLQLINIPFIILHDERCNVRLLLRTTFPLVNRIGAILELAPSNSWILYLLLAKRIKRRSS